MKFVCLGYFDEEAWEALSEKGRNAILDRCFAYDDVLREGGHFLGGEALQGARKAVTLRSQKGGVVVTDGPFAETKEQLGGFLLLEAANMEEAIALMSRHPGVQGGPFEIRPVEDLTEVIRASEQRRSSTKSG